MHVLVTDSGLGGLSICAALERRLRESGHAGPARLTYVNAWPDEGLGYNDLPDMAARAAVFDRALARMAQMTPDRLLIACNTLSIVYAFTAFSRAPAARVNGIVGAGVDLFAEALEREPAASIVLLGTKTTIEAGVHRDGLIRRGFDGNRIASVACHGLATAIERDIDGPGVRAFIDKCAADVRAAAPAGSVLFAGLCCTHYGYASDRIEGSLAETLGRKVHALDPNVRMLNDLDWPPPDHAALHAPAQGLRVDVISKVGLDESARAGIARLVGVVSPATARALTDYTHDPGLF